MDNRLGFELPNPLSKLLAHPLTRGMEIDDPRTTHLRVEIIKSKSFLRKIYDEWYRDILSHLPQGSGAVLELGSGAGFLKDYIPDLITSEVFFCRNISVVLDARTLPFPEKSLRALVLVDVLHHIPDVHRFFAEAQRCLAPGGSILLIEPWVSAWSKLIYTRLHHEPFRPDSRDWSFPPQGPLSGANGALPWIVFARDRWRFERDFPWLRVGLIQPFLPFCYLLSGGVSFRTLMPGFTYRFWRLIESALKAWPNTWPMFAFIRVERCEALSPPDGVTRTSTCALP